MLHFSAYTLTGRALYYNACLLLRLFRIVLRLLVSSAKDTKYLAQEAFFLLRLFLLLSEDSPERRHCRVRGAEAFERQFRWQAEPAGSPLPNMRESQPPDTRFGNLSAAPCIWQYWVGWLPSMKYSFWVCGHDAVANWPLCGSMVASITPSGARTAGYCDRSAERPRAS